MNNKKSFKNEWLELLNIPQVSGLYYCYDKNDDLLYVGKAKNLKSRIKEHRKNSELDREARYCYSLLKLNPDSEEAKKNFGEWESDFRIRCMSAQNSIIFDLVFQRTSRIDMEEMPHELTESREQEMIYTLKPLFNSETACDEYYEIRDG